MSDPEIWGTSGIGGPGELAPHETLPPIVVHDWIEIPSPAGAAPAQVLAPWVLDPLAPLPKSARESDDKSAPEPGQVAGDAHHGVCACTTVHSEIQEVRMARLTGIQWMIWNGELVQGDPERREYGGVPVIVQAGDNRVFVAAVDPAFELELWKPETRLVIEAFDVRWPTGFSLDDEIAYPVFNVSLEPTSSIHVHYGHASLWSGGSKPHLTDWRDGVCRIPPLGLALSSNYFAEWDDHSPTDFSEPVYVPVCVYAEDDDQAEHRLFRTPADPSGPALCNACTRVHPPEDNLHRSEDLSQACGVHVYATWGSEEEQRVALANARFGQLSEWYSSGEVPLVLSDLDWPIGTVPWRDRLNYSGSGHWIGLYGNVDTNAAWSMIVPDEAPISAHDGRVRIDGIEFRGNDLAGWYCLGGKRSQVLVMFDTGAAGARLAGLLQVSMRVGDSKSAVFRVDAHSPSGFARVDVPSPR
jgi:hypothetical protein